MQTVRIRVRKPTRVYRFACKGVELAPRDTCIVRTDRGLEYGTCLTTPAECPDELGERLQMQVVRRANAHDELTYKQILTDEERAVELCVRRIAEHNLPMKLVEAEYTFDRRKIIFYFTAEDRVDFRHLVRDLAQDLKTRIELRHIQVRDEAKFVGGLGPCGMELCCRRWLCEFMPISMKMAKRQNLSLNPEKISGQCGRLMCCLSYEDTMYGKRRRAERDKDQSRQHAADDSGDEARREGARPDAAAPAEATAGGTADPAGQSQPGGEEGQGKPRRKKRRRKKRRQPHADGSGAKPSN